MYNKFPAELVPPGVVTTTGTAPKDADGVRTVMVVLFTTVKPVPAERPKVTLLAAVNPVPVSVTNWLPEAGPRAGLIEPIVGAGR